MARAVLAVLVGALVLTVPGCSVDRAPAAAAVRQADVDFDRAVADRDVDRFRELVAEDAVFYGSEIAEGRDAVVASWSSLLDPGSTTTLRWRPEQVQVADSLDLAYTRGRYRMTVADENGGEQVLTGNYVTIWKRGGDGSWRAAVDIGTPPEPAPAESGGGSETP